MSIFYIMYIFLKTNGFFVCNQLYLQVEGMSEFQPIKLLLLQLDELLTVCKTLRHLEDRRVFRAITVTETQRHRTGSDSVVV